MQNLPEKRKCQECGGYIYGRSDKKFCSEHCRNNYYNKRYRDVNKVMRNVNNVLRKNRRILAELNPNGKVKIHRDRLLFQGFNFNYFTSSYKTKNGVYNFCYDQGYLFLPDQTVIIVTQPEGLADIAGLHS